ncbi:MAG: type II toxin-antitoxin system prevent-host-death family antitoxin [Propionibacteriaceae bacterium]|jgi:prevent-host-death family protein|nr:type II toxin-antitoxin system prevent-host-death family antitoxin [Propionibacteriaceae bacterium]
MLTPTRLTATEASRNFAAVVERASRGERFTVVKNGQVVAQIAPPDAAAPNGAALSEYFAAWSGGAFDEQAAAAVAGLRGGGNRDFERLAWAGDYS